MVTQDRRLLNTGLINMKCTVNGNQYEGLVYVFNATLNNISVISWQSCNFIGGENRRIRRKPSTCRKSMTKCVT